MKSNHTPGPWTFEYHNSDHGPYAWYALTGPCLKWNYNRTNDRQAKADATLICAAPEMLAALEAVVRVADRKTVEFDLARAAIAKARG